MWLGMSCKIVVQPRSESNRDRSVNVVSYG